MIETLIEGQVEVDTGDLQAGEVKGKRRGLALPGEGGSSVQTRSACVLISHAARDSHAWTAKQCDSQKKLQVAPQH